MRRLCGISHDLQVRVAARPHERVEVVERLAEAERERRAKIINAEGEFQAAQRLSDAAQIIDAQPATLQLRYLQTLTEIGVEKNTTIVFPLPVDIISGLTKMLNKGGDKP